MKVLFCSSNPGKLREVTAWGASRGVEIIAPASLGRGTPPAVPEGTESYFENAAAKVRAFFAWSGGLPTLADDTGLEIVPLGRRPGVVSAAYGGEALTPQERHALLVGELASVPEPWPAEFFCVIAAMMRPEEVTFSTGRLFGRYRRERAGDGGRGFGFDAAFEPVGSIHTLAALKERDPLVPTHRTAALDTWRQSISTRAAVSV